MVIASARCSMAVVRELIVAAEGKTIDALSQFLVREDAAGRMASDLARTMPDRDARIREAFRKVLSREPDAYERERSRDFLADLERSGVATDAALTRLCHALLSTNEFVTME